jgi:transposase
MRSADVTNQASAEEWGNKSVPPATKRRRYDDDFKREAVRTLLQSGKPVTAVAAGLGIEQSNLHKWKKIFGPRLATLTQNAAASSPRQADVDALRKELAKVQETVDQLRAIVSKTLRDKYISHRRSV